MSLFAVLFAAERSGMSRTRLVARRLHALVRRRVQSGDIGNR
jgi:hypothetical protein